MSLVNGAAAIPQMPLKNPLVEMLEFLITEVEKGNLSSIGLSRSTTAVALRPRLRARSFARCIPAQRCCRSAS